MLGISSHPVPPPCIPDPRTQYASALGQLGSNVGMSKLSDSVIAHTCACVTQNVGCGALRFRSMHKGWEAPRCTRRVMVVRRSTVL